MKYLLLVFSIIVSSFGFSQEKNEDYSVYHKNINKAEVLFFNQKQVDKALLGYQKVFSDFDFIFLKDLINASQIAKFSNKPYIGYLKKGFQFGFKPEMLKNYPLFKDVSDSLLLDKNFKESYKKGRVKYLSTIDFEYLSWIYDVVILDQINKSKPKYDVFLAERLSKFRSKIKEKGFPSDRLIGIDDSLIFKEIGFPKKDLSVKARNKEELYYKLQTDDGNLASSKVLLPFIHHRCSFAKLETVFIKEINKGNIHPRDVGLLYDNAYRFNKDNSYPQYCKSVRQKGYFRLNMFLGYPKEFKSNIISTNALRKKFNIVSLETDVIKKEYEEEHGFILFSGFWNCR